MVLLIDNYDSFSYNLYQLIGEICWDIKVIRNDELSVEEIQTLEPTHIILSPGPGRPEDAGICEEVVRKLGGKIPILGVCLGHQAICEAYGAKITYAKQLMHGKSSEISLAKDSRLFQGLDETVQVARYHSLATDSESIPEELVVTAVTADGEVMAVEHRCYPVYGVQFHPESILTPEGKQILENFMRIETKQEFSEGKQKTKERTVGLAEKRGNMIKEAIAKVVNKEDLSNEMMTQVMNEIMEGVATDAQKASFLTAMNMKGETIEEITSAARVMRNHCERFLNDMDVLEIVGTGGDGSNSINISTLASIVVSSVGIPVAKHGNRAASSQCGTADCLEALGVKIDLSPEVSAGILKELNICFLFAQKYHTAMRFVGGVRKEMGVRTLFNCLGPLANPAGASMQLLGVYGKDLVEPLARVLVNLGVKSAMVVYGEDNIDEISLSAPTFVCEAINGEFHTYEMKPEDYGFTRCKKEDLVGGAPQENAAIARRILEGEQGPKTDAIILNAGAAIHIAKGCTIQKGIEIAREAIQSGKALAQLEKFIACSNR